MKVLVTGASGMLGRATAQALLDRGDEVTVLQRRPAGLDCREVLGDVADAGAVADAVAGQQMVLHLAAKVDVVGPWEGYRLANVVGTRNVVAACEASAVSRLVHVSSPSVAHAGDSLVGVGAEPADVARSHGHYARSKAMAERISLSADSDSLAVLAIRPHLVWGPGDTQLVGRIVERAQAGRLPLIGTGAALIDTTYVDNAVTALRRGGRRLRRTARPWSSPTVSHGRWPRSWAGSALLPASPDREATCRSPSPPPPARSSRPAGGCSAAATPRR